MPAPEERACQVGGLDRVKPSWHQSISGFATSNPSYQPLEVWRELATGDHSRNLRPVPAHRVQAYRDCEAISSPLRANRSALEKGPTQTRKFSGGDGSTVGPMARHHCHSECASTVQCERWARQPAPYSTKEDEGFDATEIDSMNVDGDRARHAGRICYKYCND
jgi:hypothetical protein